MAGRRKKITEIEKEEMIKLARGGMKREDVAKKFGIGIGLSYKYFTREDLRVGDKRPKREIVIDLLKEGLTTTEIFKKTGVAYDYIKCIQSDETLKKGAIEVKPLKYMEEVKKICRMVEQRKIEEARMFRQQRLIEIENCRWKGVFKI